MPPIPPREQGTATPRQILVAEVKLCLATSLGCLCCGLLAWLFHWLAAEQTALTALLVVGSFYAVIGCVRLLQLYSTYGPRTPPGNRGDPPSPEAPIDVEAATEEQPATVVDENVRRCSRMSIQSRILTGGLGIRWAVRSLL